MLPPTTPSALSPPADSCVGLPPTGPLESHQSSDQTSGSQQLLRVLHVVNGEHFSGAERVQSHLGRCLPQYGVAADFACVKPGRFAEVLEQQTDNWGTCHRLPMSRRFDIQPAWRIRDLVQHHGYQLLHAHTPRTAMITAIASRLAGIPWVYHVHSPALRDSTRVWANRVNGWIESRSLKSCAHLLTVSGSLRQDCIDRGISEQRITVVPNGVPAICPARAAVPVVGGRWIIGMVALMRPRKGLEILLQSLAKLVADGHDVILRCVGPFETPEYETSVQSLIDRLDLRTRVQQVGFTQDVPAELSKLDAMILPSLCGEGLPMVVLEAMAAGLPVVATRVEGTPEAIRDGIEGLLAQPRDPESLAEKIAELMTGTHDWPTMSQAASLRHAERFSDLSMARQTAAVYRQIAPAPASSL